ncbi:MAG: hypothetical protein Q8P90_01920 [bacterium]|nr:hypothetical protein [bacterium]
MIDFFKKYLINWIKRQFNGNPLVENTGEYVSEVASAFRVGAIAVFSVISFAMIGSFVFVIGVIKGWF